MSRARVVSSTQSVPVADASQEQLDIWSRFLAQAKILQGTESQPSNEQDKDSLVQRNKFLNDKITCVEQLLELTSILIALKSSDSEESTATALENKLKKRVREDVGHSSPPARLDETNKVKKIRGNDTLDLGSQVAFRVRKLKGGEEEWIQCVVIKVLIEDAKYIVQDPEPDEHNNPGQLYKALSKDLIPIPSTSSSDPCPFSRGTQVLARYPETTSFYRAEVIGLGRDGTLRLMFEGEEEEGKETQVERQLVLALPH